MCATSATRIASESDAHPSHASAVGAAGFRHGTIVTGPGPLGGNLRLAFPTARVASLETPGYLAPAPVPGGEASSLGPGGPAAAGRVSGHRLGARRSDLSVRR